MSGWFLLYTVLLSWRSCWLWEDMRIRSDCGCAVVEYGGSQFMVVEKGEEKYKEKENDRGKWEEGHVLDGAKSRVVCAQPSQEELPKWKSCGNTQRARLDL